jgi:protoheme IX farnesyltransferase
VKSEVLAIPVGGRTADFVALTKPRLNGLVLATTLAGLYLGAEGPLGGTLVAATLIGTALVAGGASVFNQLLERDVDARMRRTQQRPLPDGRLQPRDAQRFGAALSILGVAILAFGATGLAAGVALATLVSYVAVYTPLKRRTSFATVVGAVPGALPPVIGWAAARGAISTEAVVLFAIMFLWQMPHFLAIAWLYRDDYDRAGFPLLAVVDPSGASSARQVVVYSCVLVPVSLMPTLVGLSGAAYFVGALALGILFVALGSMFARSRTLVAARRLFLGSITYLPLLFALMLLDAR